mmetsp:Transcript_21859/g.24422  ORF Transcript_21859/g.24422 Transcript_21859/m.24422 type:complete len:139 (-) Transcript_21859:67-483(-)
MMDGMEWFFFSRTSCGCVLRHTLIEHKKKESEEKRGRSQKSHASQSYLFFFSVTSSFLTTFLVSVFPTNIGEDDKVLAEAIMATLCQNLFHLLYKYSTVQYSTSCARFIPVATTLPSNRFILVLCVCVCRNESAEAIG